MSQRQVTIAQSTQTQAYMGQSVLQKGGIQASVVHLSGVKTQRGCGYGLVLFERDLPRAILLLKQRNAFVGEIIR